MLKPKVGQAFKLRKNLSRNSIIILKCARNGESITDFFPNENVIEKSRKNETVYYKDIYAYSGSYIEDFGYFTSNTKGELLLIHFSWLAPSQLEFDF